MVERRGMTKGPEPVAEEKYPTKCRQCGQRFMAWIPVAPGIGRCKECRHSGLRGWLLAPLFLIVRVVAFFVGFFGRLR